MKISELLLSKKTQAKLENEKEVQKELAEGKNIDDILEISPDQMQILYKAACHLFEEHHYADAADAFLFLITLNFQNSQFWIGLGMSTQMSGNFESAIDAYELAAIYEPENPIPYFYLAKCLFAMHERQSASLALEMAIQYAGDIEQFQELKTKALEAQLQLKKHIH